MLWFCYDAAFLLVRKKFTFTYFYTYSVIRFFISNQVAKALTLKMLEKLSNLLSNLQR